MTTLSNDLRVNKTKKLYNCGAFLYSCSRHFWIFSVPKLGGNSFAMSGRAIFEAFPDTEPYSNREERIGARISVYEEREREIREYTCVINKEKRGKVLLQP